MTNVTQPVTAPVTVPSKPWYQSKTIWTAVVIIAMSILPLITPFVQALQNNKDAVGITSAVVTLIGGILAVIWRVFFTDTTIS